MTVSVGERAPDLELLRSARDRDGAVLTTLESLATGERS